ncbi:MAG TPA: DUF1592 domain-containing protein [Roseimicrobium sp.]|nr:DUF1592 domain-containing protein [Roseimicrobium sp.]
MNALKQSTLALASLILGLAGSVTAAPAAFDSAVKPFFKTHCLECHDADTSKGGLRLDTLKPEFSNPTNFTTWERIFDKVAHGEMPPKKQPQPEQKELRPTLAWMTTGLHQASAARQASEGRVTYRRLNRTEYENTVRDLLAIETPLKELLPDDNSAHGFDNIGAALDVSSVLMERYLEAADAAIDAAMGPVLPAESKKQRYTYLDNANLLKQLGGVTVLKRDDGIVMFSSGYMPTTINNFRAPRDGRYRVKVSMYGYQTEKPVIMAAYGGELITGRGETHVIGFYDALPDKPTVVEFTDRLAKNHTFKFMPFRLEAGESARKDGAANYKGPGLAVQWVEIEGPLEETWPPESRRRLFGDLPLEPADPVSAKNFADAKARPDKAAYLMTRVKFAVKSAQPEVDAEKLLRTFIPKAFRRPVSEQEIGPYVALVKARIAQGYSFDDAMRVGYKAVLSSPAFLFFQEKPGKLDAYAVASRLSYFLWSAPPDAELLAAAANGQLLKPAILKAQTERLLKSPKAHAFTQNFLGQWLELRQIDFTTPDKKLYPEYDELLKRSMVQETELFFDELLANNLGVSNFVHSDFSMLNARLAEHYGIEGVSGQEFRKVSLPATSHRGGVMTHASVLKVTANGTTTSPVMRGKWVLDRIMGVPPDPPPKNVAAIEPDIRGTKTIREQLDKHRNTEACASCHRKIDPPGFALENFDVIGGWRDRYRVMPDPKIKRDYIGFPNLPRFIRVALGPAVDASFITSEGQPFKDVDEFKKILLKNPDQTARCVAEKLLTYATGAGIQFADRQVVEGIVNRTRSANHGLRSIVHEVVQSETFLSK